MSDETGRRRKLAFIPIHLLADMITTGNTTRAFRCISGIPPGATLVGGDYDATQDGYYLVFEHESWELIPYFERLPILDIMLQQGDT